MAVLQILDGIMTGIGVARLGVSAEGNFVLRYLMENIGYIPTLLIAKIAAILIIITLCSMSTRVSWIPKALKVLIAVYLGAAVLPWSLILISHAV